MQQKKPQKKRQQKKTGADRLVEKAFNWAGVEHNNAFYSEFDFGDFGYDGNITDDEIVAFEKATEVAVFDAIKKNKKFQKCLEKTISDLAIELCNSLKDAKYSIAEQKKYEAQIAKENAARLVRQQKAEEKIKKEKAQQAIFLEGLTGKQKKAIKKFYNLDLAAYNKAPARHY